MRETSKPPRRWRRAPLFPEFTLSPGVQKVAFVLGMILVFAGAGFSIFTIWEEKTVSGRCFAVERTLERHRLGVRLQEATNLADQEANRTRAAELCAAENNVCLDLFASDTRDFCLEVLRR